VIHPKAGLSIGSTGSREGRIEFDVLCSAERANAADNLIVAVSGQRPDRKGNGTKPVVVVGLSPAIPFEIVQTPPPPDGATER